MATPTIRELLRGTANNADITVTTGAGTAAADVLVLFHASDGSTAAGMVSPTPGTWVQEELADLGSSTSHVKCWTRPVASGGAQSVTAPKVGSADHGVHLYVVSGADTTDPTDVTAGATGAASTSHVAPSVSPATSDALLLCAVVSEVFAFGNYTAVSGMTDLTEDDLIPASTFGTMASARQVLTASGATGTRTFTYSQSKAFAAISVAIKGAGGGGAIVNGTAAASFALTATAVGTRSVLGQASAPFGFAAGLVGAPERQGLAAAVFAFAAVAAGVVSTPGTVVVRPFTGTVVRPFTGVVSRP